MTKKSSSLRIALVVPHIFMHRAILPRVIFSPGYLAVQLAEGLRRLGAEVTLCTPGPIDTAVRNETADLSLFQEELDRRGDDYVDLLKKHPFTFVTLARQLQNELIASVYERANRGEFDVVHIYTNEEESALAFGGLCSQPVVFTHHDPFNFMVKYKNNLPKYAARNWLSISMAQRQGMPASTNWVGNIYHGLEDSALRPVDAPAGGYVAYLGRIIEPKGVHVAIAAIKRYNATHKTALKLKIAGKHYADGSKDSYWQEFIEPELGEHIEFVGFVDSSTAKQQLLANADGLLVPSLFDEPFGMVSIESLACGTPVIALDSGALPEVIEHGKTGYVVAKDSDEEIVAERLVDAVDRLRFIQRSDCRAAFEARFTLERMCADHLAVYERLKQ